MKFKRITFNKSLTLPAPLGTASRYQLNVEEGFDLELVAGIGILIRHEKFEEPVWMPLTDNIAFGETLPASGEAAQDASFSDFGKLDIPIKRGPGRPPKVQSQ